MLNFFKGLIRFGFSRAAAERQDPLFGRMWFWPSDVNGRSYWETEPTVAGQRISVGFRAGLEGPSPEHAAFLRWAAAEPDALYALARPLLEPEFERWVRRPFPAAWRDAFVLAGLDIPDGGLMENPWSVSYDCLLDQSGHQFTVEFEGGRPASVSVDG
jgi:hypothetical protein